MKCATQRQLVGRTIVAFHRAEFPDGRGGIAHGCTLVLDDGSRLTFGVEETDVGTYGVAIVVTKLVQS